MNYRHAYHAGNFADCFKHALLADLVDAFARKPTPYFVLDTHAGVGRYDLEGDAARRTGEADAGIRRLLASQPAPLKRYLDLVRSLGLYPGSPTLIRALMRPIGPDLVGEGHGCCHDVMPGAGPASTPCDAEPDKGVDGGPSAAMTTGTGRRARPPKSASMLMRQADRLACCELHPEDVIPLRRLFHHDPQVEVHFRSGWDALKALLPPREKRGLVFIDPPFESQDEFATLADGLKRGHGRFGHGVFAAWYPIKQRAAVRGFHATLKMTGIRDVIAIELYLRAPTNAERLNGCGLLVINPPYRFAEQGQMIADAVLQGLGQDESGAGVDVIRIADE
jgi:23S rRNA (adenine2030-N6)-methyltransferase